MAIFLALPVLLMLLVALWFEGGKPIFSQVRLGRGGRLFRMYKLRSMVPGAEAKLAEHLAANPAAAAEWAVRQKLRNDPRITPLGWMIRKTSLDELPQLFNVLKGDMSLIGPRPMLPDQLPLYLHPSAYLAVRPGLSGLWQVTARNDESFEIRAELDKRYVERLSPWLEARIAFATLRAVLRGTGH
ncbi:MAG: sugar transferase [Pararhodobacter sp.]|nr:sugar transferase [Pararhodobacter sp.]